jgi:hypothetical protein
MTAATSDRDTRESTGRSRGFPLAAATKIYGGTLACLDASGNLVKGATSTTLKCVGVAQQTFDNSVGAGGAIIGEVKVGVFGPFANSASTDALASTDIGSDCYIVDDSTVAKTSGANTRSLAVGKVWFVDAAGVWLKF